MRPKTTARQLRHALNIGIRGLIRVGQPKMSFAPVSLGLMDGVDVVRGGSVRYGPQNKAASSSTSRPAALLKSLSRAMPARRGNPAHLPRSLRPGNRQPHAGRHRARQDLPPGLGRRLRLPARLLGRGPVQGVQLYGHYVYVDARIREAGPNKDLYLGQPRTAYAQASVKLRKPALLSKTRANFRGGNTF